MRGTCATSPKSTDVAKLRRGGLAHQAQTENSMGIRGAFITDRMYPWITDCGCDPSERRITEWTAGGGAGVAA